MDQASIRRGQGRGRGIILQDALAVAKCQTRRDFPATTEKTATASPVPTVEATVPEKDIKTWIVKQLSDAYSGIWANNISMKFEENFKMRAPPDLIARIETWSDAIETQELLPGKLFRLKNQGQQLQKQEEVEAKSQESTHERCNTDSSTSTGERAVPEASVVHVEMANRTGELCSETLIGGSTSPENLTAASTNPEEPVPEKFIRVWIKRELSSKPNGVSSTEVPSLFEKTLKRRPPSNLLATLESWSDVIDTTTFDSGKVFKLKRREQNLTIQKAETRTVISESTSPENQSATTSNQPAQPLVTDMSIKQWILKELIQKPNGLWARCLPDLFEKNFGRPAPPDLLGKVQSWSDIIVPSEVVGGTIFTLQKQNQQMQNAESKEEQSREPSQVRSCHQSTSERSPGTLKIIMIPEEGFHFDVHVEWANSPGEFCIIPLELLENLRRMMQEMNEHFWSQNEVMMPIQDSHVRPGRLCAGNYNGKWYRVIINGRTQANDTVLVSLPDFCFKTELQTGQLRELPAKFLSLPACGIKACLYGVSATDENQWSDEIREALWSIVCGRNFVCFICERDVENTTATVRLIDTSDDEDVIVDEILEALTYTKHV